MPALAQRLKARPQKPADLPIEPHRMDFTFDAQVPRYWFDNDPFLTHFLGALSLLFPEGERFFVDAVRHFRDQVKGEERQREISGFIGQEAMHSLEHKTFNAFLENNGYPADKLEAILRRELQQAREEASPLQQLAITVALEHITAILAELMLEHEDLRERLHESVRDLWVWHAVEETEHKAVAWDLYQDVGGDYATRVTAMLRATLLLAYTTTRFQAAFLRRDGLSRNPMVWAKGIWRLWGYKGYLSRLAPAYLSYFRPNFHPWKIDNSPVAKAWRRRLTSVA